MKKKNDDFLKKVVICMLVFLAVFTVACGVLFIITGDEPSTLIGCVFAAVVGEFGCCSWIKTKKQGTVVEASDSEDADEQAINE